jgi:outer membrane protein assembly factor BamB
LLALGAATLAVVAGLAALIDADDPGELAAGLTRGGDAAEVELPEPAELPQPDPPAVARPPDPGQGRVELDCAAAGCERWRRPLDGLEAGWYDGVEVVAIAGPNLVALDADTGEERWSRPLADHLHGVSPADRAVWRPTTVTGDDRWLVAVGAAGVQVVTRSGEEVWSSVLPDDESLHTISVVDDVVVLASERWPDDPTVDTADGDEETAGSDGGEVDAVDPRGFEAEVRLVAYDAATGDVRWTREGLAAVAPTPPWLQGRGLVLAREDDGYVALDPATGEERYRLTTGTGRWLFQVGEYLVVSGRQAPGSDRTTIHAAEDGRELAELPEGELGWEIDVDGLLIAVHIPPSASGGPQVLALDADGAMVWAVVLDPADGTCCPSVLDAGGGVVLVSSGSDGDIQHLDVRSGREVARTSVVRSTDDPAAPQDEWQFARDLTGRTSSSGNRTIFRDVRGRAVEARGSFVHPLTDTSGRAARDGRLVLWAEQELIAVDLPSG